MYRSVRKAAVARRTFSSQKVQNTISRTTFGSWDVEEWYAAVARSAFSSQIRTDGFRALFEDGMCKSGTAHV